MCQSRSLSLALRQHSKITTAGATTTTHYHADIPAAALFTPNPASRRKAIYFEASEHRWAAGRSMPSPQPALLWKRQSCWGRADSSSWKEHVPARGGNTWSGANSRQHRPAAGYPENAAVSSFLYSVFSQSNFSRYICSRKLCHRLSFQRELFVCCVVNLLNMWLLIAHFWSCSDVEWLDNGSNFYEPPEQRQHQPPRRVSVQTPIHRTTTPSASPNFESDCKRFGSLPVLLRYIDCRPLF